MNANQQWYSVSTYYQYSTAGKPKPQFRHYQNASVMIEERVVLFLARSHDEAEKLADIEARDYASYSYVNPFGQKVRVRYIGCGGAFALFDEPGTGVEVYSRTEIRLPRLSINELKRAKIGQNHGKVEAKMRLKFQDANFTRVKP